MPEESTCRRPPPVRRSPSPTSSSAPSPPSGAPTATGWPSCSSSAKPRSARPSPSPRPSPTTVPNLRRRPLLTGQTERRRLAGGRALRLRRQSGPWPNCRCTLPSDGALTMSVRPRKSPDFAALRAPLFYDVTSAGAEPTRHRRATARLRPCRATFRMSARSPPRFHATSIRSRATSQFCRQVRCSGVVLNMCWIITLGVPSQGVPHIRNYHSTRGGIAVVERSSPAVRNLFPTSDHLLEISRGGCSCGIGLPESSDVSKNQKRLLRRYRNADWSQPKIARALEASKRAKGRLNHGAVSTEPVRALKDLVRVLVGAVGQVRFFAYDNTLATPLRGEGSPTSLSNFNALQRFPCYLLLDIHRD